MVAPTRLLSFLLFQPRLPKFVIVEAQTQRPDLPSCDPETNKARAAASARAKSEQSALVRLLAVEGRRAPPRADGDRSVRLVAGQGRRGKGTAGPEHGRIALFIRVHAGQHDVAARVAQCVRHHPLPRAALVTKVPGASAGLGPVAAAREVGANGGLEWQGKRAAVQV